MSSRSMTKVVTADTMALNAVLFGYGGHSTYTPHHAIQDVWWTDERIEAKVTQEFVVSKLRPKEREQLFQPMFGDSGLTEDTYMDRILGKMKRIFMILVECNCTDQIHGLAEDAWDDDDLPIPMSETTRLALSYKEDSSLNKRFYHNQFRFLLRPLDLHGHIDYAANEVVPTEYVHRMAPSAALQKWSRFHLPKMPSRIYAKRKVVLGEKGEIEKFLADIQSARAIEHEHIAPVLATWSHAGAGYIMTSMVGEHTLRSFINFRTPASLQKASKQERQKILLEWLHCLAGAVAYLHRKGIAHSAICPSNIVIDENNKIAFSDLGFLETFQKDKKFEADELYNYGAPELFAETQRANSEEMQKPLMPMTRNFLRRRRNSNDSDHSGSDKSRNSAKFVWNQTKDTYVKIRTNSETTIKPSFSQTSLRSMTGSTNKQHDSMFTSRLSIASKATTIATSNTTTSRSSNSDEDRRGSDIFSLSCVFLDIITFVLKRKPDDFKKHRSTKHKNTIGRGSHVDVSFHNNASKVQNWMDVLDIEVRTQMTNDQALCAWTPLFQLISDMQNPEPQFRPNAADVQERVHNALEYDGSMENLCCAHSADLRPPSRTLSFAQTSTGGSNPNSNRQSRAAKPELRLAMSPETEDMIAPAIPAKSSRRPRISSASSVAALPTRVTASRPATPRRADTALSEMSPIPPVPPGNSSMLDLKHWGRHKTRDSVESRRRIGVFV